MSLENLKFRAWDKGTKLMNDVTVVDLENEEVYYHHWRYGHSEAIAFSDIELLQSTGLKDAHGTEIYEKDIVRDSYGDVFLIEWLDGGFVLTDFFSGGYDHCEIDDLESYEVIGNQFQHPHLLEE